MNKQKHHIYRRIFLFWEQIDNPICHNPIQAHVDAFEKFRKFYVCDLQKGEKRTPNKAISRQPLKRRTRKFYLG